MQQKMAHSLNSTENLICFSDDDDVAPQSIAATSCTGWARDGANSSRILPCRKTFCLGMKASVYLEQNKRLHNDCWGRNGPIGAFTEYDRLYFRFTKAVFLDPFSQFALPVDIFSDTVTHDFFHTSYNNVIQRFSSNALDDRNEIATIFFPL